MNPTFALDEGALQPGLRQAALMLHGVARADREWMMGQLPESHRRALASLLDELHALGVPTSADLVKEALALSPTDAAPSAIAHEALALDLATVPTKALHRVLCHEPDALIAHVMAMLDSRSRIALLARFALPRRRVLAMWVTRQDALVDPSTGGLLRRALGIAVQARLNDAARHRGHWIATPWRASIARVVQAVARLRTRAARRADRRDIA